MKKIVLLLLFLCASQWMLAQNTLPFYKDIEAFQKSDKETPPPQNAILFVGSSSFTYWKDVQDYFPQSTIINRGFGGSTLQDLIRYQSDVIFPYKAKQIVVYCGENDFASSTAVTADTVCKRFVKLFKNIRKKQPNVPIAYISMKPSPSRWAMKDKIMQGNALIEAFLKTQKKAKYINVWNIMLDGNGKPKSEIFTKDSLHMNAKGYEIWKEIITPYLIKK